MLESMYLSRRGFLDYPCSENKGADHQLRVTAKLVCAFVLTYADCWFSYAAAQINKPGRRLSSIGSVSVPKGSAGHTHTLDDRVIKKQRS